MGVYSCSSRKSEGFFWFITNTQLLGMRFLFSERIQEVLCVFVFPSNFASEHFLQNLLPTSFSLQVRTTQELIEIRATCHPSASPLRRQGRVQTHPFWKRENHLRASSPGLGILGSAGPE